MRCFISTARLRWEEDGDSCCWKGCPSPKPAIITSCLLNKLYRCSLWNAAILWISPNNSCFPNGFRDFMMWSFTIFLRHAHFHVPRHWRSVSSPFQEVDEASPATIVILGMLWFWKSCEGIYWTQQFGKEGCYKQQEKGIELKGDSPQRCSDSM